jgi:hypothetical protein
MAKVQVLSLAKVQVLLLLTLNATYAANAIQVRQTDESRHYWECHRYLVNLYLQSQMLVELV